jgi:hypothetical protein
MKLKIFILLFFAVCSVSLLNAQCDDCFNKDDDWKLAGGVTLYSNNHFVEYVNILERQPLEFNVRYKIKDRHILRASIPFLNKVNKHGEPEVSDYPLEEVSLENYLETLHNDDWYYASYCKTLSYNESLHGLSLGYDYNYYLGKSLSLFAGVDLACYYYTLRSKYYNITYGGLDTNGMSELGLITFSDIEKSKTGLSIRPLLGIRYKFQKLLFEANLGYAFIRTNFVYSDKSSYIDINNITSERTFDSGARYHNKNFQYQFSLYYTF